MYDECWQMTATLHFSTFTTPPPFSDSDMLIDMLILLPNQTLRELRESVGVTCHSQPRDKWEPSVDIKYSWLCYVTVTQLPHLSHWSKP